MDNFFTLIIILHGRHKNLDRLLKYYEGCSFAIIIADSSKERHQFKEIKNNYKYYYTPGISYTEKIEQTLKKVETPYVAMVADDDFTVPEAMLECVSFLEANRDYAAAEGTCVAYIKESVADKQVDYRPIYRGNNYDIENDDGFERLEQMVSNYRSILYAVHKTDFLKIAYENSGPQVSNLYLNEYLANFIPVLYGKYKQLPMLYQVREFARDSDDKVTDNLNVIVQDQRYEAELRRFINIVSEKASCATGVEKFAALKRVSLIVGRFANSPFVRHASSDKSFKKRIGLVISKVPYLGNLFISLNRRLEKSRDFEKFLKTAADRKHLKTIELLLRNE